MGWKRLKDHIEHLLSACVAVCWTENGDRQGRGAAQQATAMGCPRIQLRVVETRVDE